MKNKIKIDLTRHLCESCAKCHNCEYTECELGEMANVVRCKKYSKRSVNASNWRAEEGGMYFHMVFNSKSARWDKVPKSRIDHRTVVDNILHESGNYFMTEGECWARINELEKR